MHSMAVSSITLLRLAAPYNCRTFVPWHVRKDAQQS